MRSTDLHRFLPYGIFFRHEDKRAWSFLTEIIFSHKLHKFHSVILPQTSFSPTDYTNNTDSFFFFFDSLFDCVKCALRICTDFCLTAFFLDMKTREHDLSHGDYFLPRIAQNSRFIVWIVLWLRRLLYGIFILYL